MTLTKAAIMDLHAGMHECLDVILDHVAGVPANLMNTEVSGFGHATLSEQFSHLLTNETAWLDLLQQRPVRRSGRVPLTTVDDCRKAKMDVMAATRLYLDSTSDLQLNTELARYPEEWVGPPRAPGFILLHVITHAFHHKGQITAMLRLLGYPAPDTDLQRVET